MQVSEQILAKIAKRYKLSIGYMQKLLQTVRSYPPSEQSGHIRKAILEEVSGDLNDFERGKIQKF